MPAWIRGRCPPTRSWLAQIDPRFDESLFAPAESAGICILVSRVARGYARMRQQRVVIAGLARDIEPILPVTIARIECLGHVVPRLSRRDLRERFGRSNRTFSNGGRRQSPRRICHVEATGRSGESADALPVPCGSDGLLPIPVARAHIATDLPTSTK